MLVTFFTLQNGTKYIRLEKNEIAQSTEAHYRLNKLSETSYSNLVKKKSLIITNGHHFE